MEVIVGSRFSGKTTKLIEQAAPYGSKAIIVVHSEHEAQRVYRAGQRITDEFPMPIPFEAFLRRERTLGRWGSVVFVDNVDLLLQSFAGPLPIQAITVNGFIDE